MKKSEILKYLNETSCENVKSYYVHGEETKILVIYIKRLDWEHIAMLEEYILNITADEKNEGTIRIAIDGIEFD